MSCRKQVSQGAISFGCAEPTGDGHDGPCWAREVARSVSNRKQWEAAQRRVQASSAPARLVDLGMQGDPKPFQIDPEQREGRRLHPDEARRLQTDPDFVEPLENQIVNTAGGVDVSGVLTKDPRYEVYERREQQAPGNEWKSSETPQGKSEPEEPSGFQAVLDDALKRDIQAVVNNTVISGPTKQREGDQPLPIVTDGVAIQDLVIADIEKRKAVGIERYGTILQAGNGRDAILDLYEELLDACMYCKQILVETSE